MLPSRSETRQHPASPMELVELEKDRNRSRNRRKPRPLRIKIREAKLLEIHFARSTNPEILRPDLGKA